MRSMKAVRGQLRSRLASFFVKFNKFVLFRVFCGSWWRLRHLLEAFRRRVKASIRLA